MKTTTGGPIIFHDDDNYDTPIEWQPPCGQEQPAENYQEVFLFLALVLKNDMVAKERLCPLPADFVFCMNVLFIWKEQTTHKLRQWYGNIHFHCNNRCVQRLNCDISIEDITISDDTCALLSTDHMRFLKHKGLLQALVQSSKYSAYVIFVKNLKY